MWVLVVPAGMRKVYFFIYLFFLILSWKKCLSPTKEDLCPSAFKTCGILFFFFKKTKSPFPISHLLLLFEVTRLTKKEHQEERCDAGCPSRGDCESFQGHRLPLGGLTECQLPPPKPTGPGGRGRYLTHRSARTDLWRAPISAAGATCWHRPLVISPLHARSKEALCSDASLLEVDSNADPNTCLCLLSEETRPWDVLCYIKELIAIEAVRQMSYFKSLADQNWVLRGKWTGRRKISSDGWMCRMSYEHISMALGVCYIELPVFPRATRFCPSAAALFKHPVRACAPQHTLIHRQSRVWFRHRGNTVMKITSQQLSIKLSASPFPFSPPFRQETIKARHITASFGLPVSPAKLQPSFMEPLLAGYLN